MRQPWGVSDRVLLVGSRIDGREKVPIINNKGEHKERREGQVATGDTYITLSRCLVCSPESHTTCLFLIMEIPSDEFRNLVLTESVHACE